MANFKVYLSILDRLAPFYFLMNRNGTVFHMGPSMAKLCGPRTRDPHFEELFAIESAQRHFPGKKPDKDGEIMSLRMKKKDALFRGEVIYFPRRQLKLFVLNLVADSKSQVQALGLSPEDFAIHDPIFEYLELNQKIRDTTALAAQALQAKSIFLSNMSHELRTPLTGLLGMASLLEQTSLDSSQKEYVRMLTASAEMLVTLIDDILDFSRLQSGTFDLEYRELNLREFMNRVVQEFSPLARDKKLYLVLNYLPGPSLQIRTDPLKLGQVLSSLLRNAIKFTESGGITLEVELGGPNSSGNRTLLIRLEDTGIGMDEDTQKQIFSPFVQGDSSSNKKYQGVGLGLSASHKIVEALGGRIDVRSRMGKGSIFSVTIPLAEPLTIPG